MRGAACHLEAERGQLCHTLVYRRIDTERQSIACENHLLTASSSLAVWFNDKCLDMSMRQTD